MREGWKYKKLGEVCTIERGGSPRPINDYITDSADGINWIKIGDATEGSKYIVTTAEKIKPEGMKKSRFVHKGDFILSNSMSFGKPYILGIDGCIHDGWLVIHDDKNTFNKDYLYYYLGSPTIYSEFKRLAVGGVVNNLNSNLVRGVNVAVPSLSEQQSIVAELDKINELISLKKAQLSDLDSLAQSIFYDMFGDPITNEKGWKEGKMGEYCTITSSKRIFANEYCEEGVPFYRGKEITELSKDLPISIELYISHSRYEEIKREYGIPTIGDILITAVGTIGNIWVVNDNSPFYFKDGNIVWVKDIKDFDPGFFKTILTIQISAYKHEMAQGCAYNALTIVNLKKMKVLLPPLSLQQEFAKRIELIEQQKTQISSTIKDLETLLASRMQHWFD